MTLDTYAHVVIDDRKIGRLGALTSPTGKQPMSFEYDIPAWFHEYPQGAVIVQIADGPTSPALMSPDEVEGWLAQMEDETGSREVVGLVRIRAMATADDPTDIADGFGSLETYPPEDPSED